MLKLSLLVVISIGLMSTANGKMPPNKKSKELDYGTRENFFVITSIFNPSMYKSRYNLYHDFVRHMNETNAQLITIECIFPSLNQFQFQVTDSNNPNHIQLKSKSIYWMKEDLINIAVERLPAHAKWVAWVDADIQFHNKNWVDLAIQQLQKYLAVQLFTTCQFLGPPPQFEILRNDYSFGYSVVHGKMVNQKKYHIWYPHSGYAWAMEINAFKKIGGLPDFDIVGSGDLHFAFSLLNKVALAIEKPLHSGLKEAMLSKARETFTTLQNISKVEKKSIVGYVPMIISHHWHGTRKNRRYMHRWTILIDHKFDYYSDIRRNAEGLFDFVEGGKTDPNNKTLQESILSQFQLLKEDDVKYEFEDNIVYIKEKKPVTGSIIPTNDRFCFRNDSLKDEKCYRGFFIDINTQINRRAPYAEYCAEFSL